MPAGMRILLEFSATLLLSAQAPPPPDTTPVRVEPIVVTATREARSVFDAPVAVTTVGADALKRGAGIGLDEGLGLAPGVLAQSRAGGTDIRLVIRGFGARGAGDRSNSGTSRGVRVLVDGVPETEPDGRTSFDLIDLSTVHGIEVVRSNSSAAWGNAAGGVVSLTTIPPLGEPFGEARGMAGSFGLTRLIARGATGLGAGRLTGALTRTDSDGWRSHSDSRRTLASFGLITHPDERTAVRFSATAADNFFRIPGPLTQAEVDDDPRQANATYAARDERRHNRLARLSATAERHTGATTSMQATIFASPKLLERSERGTYRDFTRLHVGGSAVYRRGGLLTAGRGSLALGADIAWQGGEILFRNLTAGGGRGDTVRTDKREDARNLGLFAQAEVTAGTRWIISAGLRWDEISYDVQDRLSPSLDAEKRFRGITPRVALTFRPGSGHAFYASLGGGVEAPAANETDPAGTFGQDTITAINPLLEPIRSRTLEAGTRRRFRRGSYDAAVYVTDVTNEIVPYRGGRFYFTAGRARRSGIEIAGSLNATGALTLEGALTLSRNRYVEYVVDSVHYGNPGALADYSGNEVVGVPSVFSSGAVAWSTGGGTPLALRLSFQQVGEYFADDANSVRVPGSVILGASVSIARPMPLGRGIGLLGAVSLANLLDRRTIGSAFLNPDVVNGQAVAFEPGAPRTLLVSLSLTSDSGRR